MAALAAHAHMRARAGEVVVGRRSTRAALILLFEAEDAGATTMAGLGDGDSVEANGGRARRTDLREEKVAVHS